VEFDDEYRDFVLGATFTWGAGAPEDYCGFSLRDRLDSSYYTVNLSREGRVWWIPRIEERWGDRVNGDGDAILTAADAVNTLILVGVGGEFTLYINGERAETFHDDRLALGELGVLGGTYDASDESGCTFTDVWAWDLNGG
jgi:hypothetical protein